MNRNQQTWLAIGVFAVLLAAMLAATTGNDVWSEQGANGEEDLDALAQDLFTDHVVALEVLGVLLTAAMIGALAIARPLATSEDRDVYAPTSGAHLAATQATSLEGATFEIDDDAIPKSFNEMRALKMASEGAFNAPPESSGQRDAAADSTDAGTDATADAPKGEEE
jgi:hypothetical protein